MTQNVQMNAPQMKTRHKKVPEHRFNEWLHSPSCKCTLLLLAAFLILVVIFLSVCAPRKYDLQVGSISHVTIDATRDVVDEVGTEERRVAAENSVEPTYRFQPGVKEEVLSSLDETFSELRTIQQYGQTLKDDNSMRSYYRSFSEEEIDYALSLVDTLSLSRTQITTLLRTETQVFEDMVSTVTTAVENSLNTTIREGQVSQSILTIQQIVGYKVDVSLTQTILPAVLRTCVKPNMIIDQEATDEAIQKAREAVEPVVFLQGQNIVREGDRITQSQLEMIRSLGLLNDDDYDYSIYGGALINIFLAMIALVMLLRLLLKDFLTDIRHLTVILLVLILCVGLSALISLLPSLYIMPAALGAILCTVLLGYRAGLCITVPLAILFAGLTSCFSSTTYYDVVLILANTLLGSVATTWFLKGKPQRVRVLLAGGISAAAGVLMIIGIKLLTNAETLDMIHSGTWTVVGGILSGALAVALQPVFEILFLLPTPSRLLELTNPNQPLMKRLMIEAPGTYHHSIIVANLAEAAADKIGANAYLARAGAYYHDIGKLKRPEYFSENQRGSNPHDKTDPYVSAAILISHTKDGILLAQQQRFPPEVKDIILQHHGVTPVMFFYHKALQMANGNPIDINDFRYGGPKPQTKEAAIVMMADSIEAAVRSMKDPTPKAIDQFIERLIRGKLEDGQLSDSPLSLRDIDQICEAFSSILKGVYHGRIEYPKVSRTLMEDRSVSVHHDEETSAQAPASEQAEAVDTKDTEDEATPAEAVNDVRKESDVQSSAPSETAVPQANEIAEAVNKETPESILEKAD